MHGVPSVSYPVGRNRLGTLVAVAGWVLGALAWCAWLLLAPGSGWRQGLGLAVLLLCAALAWRQGRGRAGGRLAWDGQGWQREAAGGARPGAVSLRLDLQRCLLLLWRAEDGRAEWIWLARADDPPRWEALRRAVYFRGRNEVPQQAQPPVA